MGEERTDQELEDYLHQALKGGRESPVMDMVDYDPGWSQRFAGTTIPAMPAALATATEFALRALGYQRELS